MGVDAAATAAAAGIVLLRRGKMFSGGLGVYKRRRWIVYGAFEGKLFLVWN